MDAFRLDGVKDQGLVRQLILELYREGFFHNFVRNINKELAESVMSHTIGSPEFNEFVRERKPLAITFTQFITEVETELNKRETAMLEAGEQNVAVR